MVLEIKKAERKQKKGKFALIGVSGGGKTYTALRLAAGLKTSGRILLFDTERDSATLYSDLHDFDHANLPNNEPETFIAAMKEAAAAKYEVLIIDSISHAWERILELHQLTSEKTRNSFTAWKHITPIYNRLINCVLAYPGHTIVTMRAKSEYVIEETDKGKQAPRKVGLGAVMRPGSEYEFDVVGIIDINHNLMIEKTRIDWLADKILPKADEDLGGKIRDWLASGKPVEKKKPAPQPEEAPPPAKTAAEAEAKKPAGKVKIFAYDISAAQPQHIEALVQQLEQYGARRYKEGDSMRWISEKALPGLEDFLVKRRAKDAEPNSTITKGGN